MEATSRTAGVGAITTPVRVCDAPRVRVVAETSDSPYETARPWWYLVACGVMNAIAIWVMVKVVVISSLAWIFTGFNHGIFRKVWLKGLPRPFANSLFFDRLSPNLMTIRETAPSWKALEVIWQHPITKKQDRLGWWLANIWKQMLVAQAVRNRPKLVEEMTIEAALEAYERDGEVIVAELACGATRALLRAINRLINEHNIPRNKIRAFINDKDPEALSFATGIARDLDIQDLVQSIPGDLRNMNQHFNGIRPNVVGMVGIPDYWSDPKWQARFGQVHELLRPGGILISGNIMPMPEHLVLRWLISWWLIYRTEDQLWRLIEESSFSRQLATIQKEPLNVFAVLRLQKELKKEVI